MENFMVSALFLSLLYVGACDGSSSVIASVYMTGPSSLEIKVGVRDTVDSIVYGSYEDDPDKSGGWKVLRVSAGYGKDQYTQYDIMYAAGYLEGFLTQVDIYDMYYNMANVSLNQYTSEEIQQIKTYFSDQDIYAEVMSYKLGSTTRFWNYTSLILAQFQGMIDGYAKAAPDSMKLDDFAFNFIAGTGDFIDIPKMLFPPEKPEMAPQDYIDAMYKGHCSALIKLLPDYDNIFASHSTWFYYSSMLRIYKHYAFKLPEGKFGLPATEIMSFSSYPGFLSSLDDFYIMDSGLVMLQTTNPIFNYSLYSDCSPSSLLAWHRVRLANWLASSGKEWAGIVTQENSGTYNNQYMVLDLKKIDLKKEVQDDALWVIEQIPGLMITGDQTAILREGYWPSYNVPFYEEIYNLSGCREAQEAVGDIMTYQLCPRAKIFRRDQGKVVDMESMKSIMRYNNYTMDPFAKNNSMNSICSRGDLLEVPFDGGCTDTKVTDFFSANKLEAYVVNGPTAQGIPPFSWSKTTFNVSHAGQPDVFDFTFAKLGPYVTKN